MAVRNLADDAFATRTACVSPSHVGRSAEFVNKHKLIQPDIFELIEPLGPRYFDVRPVLFGGEDRLFFRVIPSDRVARQIVGTLTLLFKALASSANVMSGCLRISCSILSRSRSVNLLLLGT